MCMARLLVPNLGSVEITLCRRCSIPVQGVCSSLIYSSLYKLQDNSSQMFIRKINYIDGRKLSVNILAADPHGEFVCIYDDQQDTFFVLQAMSVLKHFQVYRYKFGVDRRYRETVSVPHLFSFKAEQQGETVSSIIISPKIQQSQFILVIMTYSLESIQVGHEFSIRHRQIYKFTAGIVKATVFDNYLYVYLHDGSRAKIDVTINNDRDKFIKRKQSVSKLIGLDNLTVVKQPKIREQGQMPPQLFTLVDNQLENAKLWQSINGHLMLNDRVISSQFTEDMYFPSSFDEFIHKEDSETHPVKYEISMCEKYVIGFCAALGQARYSFGSECVVRSQRTNWNQVGVLLYHPEINQFWTSYQMYQTSPYTHKHNANKRQVKQKILMAYYHQGSKQLRVAWLVVELGTKRKVICGQESSCQKTQRGWQQQSKVKYQSKEEGLLYVENMKHDIYGIKWISLNSFLFYDSCGNLLFVQFNAGLLQEQNQK